MRLVKKKNEKSVREVVERWAEDHTNFQDIDEEMSLIKSKSNRTSLVNPLCTYSERSTQGINHMKHMVN